MTDTATATVRTTWNGTIVTGLIVAVAKVFGWEISLDDLAPFIPVIMVVIGVTYRASLALAEWKPILGRILFGVDKPPVNEYPAQPEPTPEFP